MRPLGDQEKYQFSHLQAPANSSPSPKIDALINNAGILDSFAAADTFVDEEFDRVIAVNLAAPLKMMRAVLPFMKSRELGGESDRTGGAIVNVCSKASMSGAASGLAYTASKHALVSLPCRLLGFSVPTRVSAERGWWCVYVCLCFFFFLGGGGGGGGGAGGGGWVVVCVFFFFFFWGGGGFGGGGKMRKARDSDGKMGVGS